jgi:ribosomal protein S12 methylthiotransferase
MSNRNKINFTSLGCARNLVDTEVMLGIVLKAGYEIVYEREEADFLVVNTCGFLQSARDEGIATIKELYEIKKKDAKIIAVGCMVQKHKSELVDAFPDLHFLLGSGDAGNILEAIESEHQGENVSDAKSYLQQGEVPRLLSTPRHYAYLKIAEGCRKNCAFCIIPKIKGKLKSKPIERILTEFKALLNSGVKEVILIAQDLGDYGKDQVERPSLHNLLREMLKIEGDFWLRMLYLYPDEIDEELISIMKSDSRLLPYLDMPLQHINDRVLKSMYRKTSKAQIIEIITRLRKEIPNVVIRTSLMVGFPGETEEEFEELVAFVKQYKLDNIGIFKYSKEEESASALMEGHIDEATKEERLQKLSKAQAEVVEANNERYIGQKLEVIIEGYHPESEFLMMGRFYGQTPDIDGSVIINDTRGVKEFSERYLVEITDAMGYDLIGGVIKRLSKTEKKKKAPQLTLI